MKIYISATYRDLKAYRVAVAAVLRRMGHDVIGMEDYVAEGVRPLQRCLADVTNCTAYVGIVAWRYGYIPKDLPPVPSPVPAGAVPGKTSLTEFEFRQAVQTKKNVLMFLLDPEAEWPSNQYDALSADGDHGAAIAAWRQEIGQQYLASFFRTPEELASLVSAAVYRVEMNRQMSLESLTVDSRFNQPFIRNGPVVDSTLGEIKNVIAGPQGIQCLHIDLGQGLDWWMTRLYFLSSLAADLTSIQSMVFVGEGINFIGMIDPVIVKERLAGIYPTLRQYEVALAQSGPQLSDLLGEVDRRAGIWTGIMNTVPGGEQNMSIFVTRSELERWFAPYMIAQAIDWQPDNNSALQIQRLLDWPLRFVPVVENGAFARVVDKQSLSEQIARLFVREQVSRALSTVR
jgi:hypothetical protein